MSSRKSVEKSNPLGQSADQTDMPVELLNQAIVHAASRATESASDKTDAASSMSCAAIIGLSSDGDVLVQLEHPSDAAPIACDVLISPGGMQLQLEMGDRVLVHAPLNAQARGCILGRVGRYRPNRVTAGRQEGHVVIEADQQLSLRCGDTSIEMRKDGKLMICGTDLLSKAKRTQRIKGGNVAIN